VVILLVHKPYERLRYEIRPQRFIIGIPCKSEKLYEGLGKGLGNPSHFGIESRLRTEIALPRFRSYVAERATKFMRGRWVPPSIVTCGENRKVQHD